jgi:hypothetical protein
MASANDGPTTGVEKPYIYPVRRWGEGFNMLVWGTRR